MVTLKHTAKRLDACPRVETLGVFGAGKTTLVRRLAGPSRVHFAEDHGSNPYWGRDDATSISGALPYDLYFLLHHGRLSAEPSPADATGLCDWSFATDRLWASMRLGERQLNVYDAVLQETLDSVGPPLGYLYLRQPAEVIAARIVRRGREPEKELLESLAQAASALHALVNDLDPELVLACGDDLDPDDFGQALDRWRGMRDAGR